MAKKKLVLEVVNSSGLTEADWIGINKVKALMNAAGGTPSGASSKRLATMCCARSRLSAPFFRM